MIDLLKDALSMGGNAAMMFIAFALWKFDRRLLVVETRCNINHEKED